MNRNFAIVAAAAVLAAFALGSSQSSRRGGESGCCPSPTLLLGKEVQDKGSPPAYRNAEGKLLCPVMGGVVASEEKAAGFSDYNGRRYYFCCGGCKPAFDENPAKFVRSSEPPKEGKADAPVLEAKAGKYVVELWPPDEGVFAGEEIDIEMGVFDSTKKESDGGLAGVPDATVSAVVTMPEMPGMPEQRPHIHREGRAGVHGLELFFPHGGLYQIDLTVTPKGEEPFKTSLRLNVLDERPTAAGNKKLPYALEVVEFPRDAQAGKPVELRLRVLDTKTNRPQTRFEVVHERPFHLLIASKDLSVFMHEHPKMRLDGTWVLPNLVFPAGGEYWVYGDVAPRGKGSRILITKVSVGGEPPKGGALAENLGPSADGGLAGVIEPLETPVPIGKSTTLRVRLADENTGQPAGDLEPWLGAAGHLMIIHEDGQTVVHSHPREGEETAALVKRGEVQFTARFPKPGMYRAFAQFQRGGEVKTLAFALSVK